MLKLKKEENKLYLEMLSKFCEYGEKHNINKYETKKARVVLMFNQNIPITKISNELQYSRPTIYKIIEKYNSSDKKNFKKIFGKNTFKSEHPLDKFLPQIRDDIKSNPYLSYSEASSRINNKYGVNIDRYKIRRFLNKHNIFTANSNNTKNFTGRKRFNTIQTTNKYKRTIKINSVLDILLNENKETPFTYKSFANRVFELTGIKLSKFQTQEYMLKYIKNKETKI